MFFDLGIGKALLFLVPGLFVYSCLFGLFGLSTRSQAFRAPAPPVNSVKAATIILISSLLVHLLSAGAVLILQFVTDWAHARCSCIPKLTADPVKDLAERVGASNAPDSITLVLALGISLGEGLIAYFVTSKWLRKRVADNTLPLWLYGWTAKFANVSDEDDKVLWAVILTDQDVNWRTSRQTERPMTVAYGGIVHDVALDADGGILRVNLNECERYLVDMTVSLVAMDLEPLSYFEYMTIERARIRNITFELFDEDT